MDFLEEKEVELYIFDISRGHGIPPFLVGAFMNLTGIRILHTGVVVHNRQFQYGRDGVEELNVDIKNNMIKKVHMGYTHYSLAQIKQHLADMKKQDRWQQKSFNFETNNSHHFSEALVQFLCGEGVLLPKEVYTFNKLLGKSVNDPETRKQLEDKIS